MWSSEVMVISSSLDAEPEGPRGGVTGDRPCLGLWCCEGGVARAFWTSSKVRSDARCVRFDRFDLGGDLALLCRHLCQL